MALNREAALPPSDLGLVFTATGGTPLNQRNVKRAFDEDCAAAGLGHIRIHDLRHAAASYLLANGASLDDVKRTLGHANIAMTSDLYGHMVQGRAAEIARAMDRAPG